METSIQTRRGRSFSVGRWVLTVTVIASAMDFVNQSAVTVALPAIQSTFQATGSQLLWVVNSYGLLLASLILVGGSLGDRLGRKRVFMTGIALYALASLVCGLAPSIFFLVVARAFQGAAGALMIPGSLALITAFFPPKKRGGAFGTWAAGTTIAMIAGPLIGGFLAEAGLWRAVFLINLPMASAALVAMKLRVPESKDENLQGGLDLSGAALVTLGLAGLVYGFTSAPDLGFENPRIIAALIIGAAALMGFVIVELYQKNPMISLMLFRSRTFTGANLLTLFLYGGLYAYILFFNLNLIQAQGYRESLAGFAFLPFIILLAAISRWSGRLVDRIGPRLPLILGPSVVAVSFLVHSLIGITSGPKNYWTTFFPAVLMAGIGMGITVAPLTTTVMSSVADRYAGTASGINNATSRIAAVLAIAILGSAALFRFEGEVGSRTARMDLPQQALLDLQEETSRLGQASVPVSVPPDRVAEVSLALRGAFVDTIQLMMTLCTALAAAAAFMAAILVERRLVQRE